MRKRRPISREIGTPRDTGLIVIASEDRYAVRQYFEMFETTRIQFHFLETTDGKSAPQHVMARLDEYLEEYDIGEEDHLWFVGDTDHWTDAGHIANLKSVVQQCKQKGIGVALSNPCFDLWLLLHFSDAPSSVPLKCDEIGELIRRSTGSFNKRRVYDLDISNAAVLTAIDRADAIRQTYEVIPSKLGTNVDQIVRELYQRRMISIR